MELKSKGTELNKEASSKKQYTTPQLLIYGNVREITKNLGPRGANDAGGGGAAGPKTGT